MTTYTDAFGGATVPPNGIAHRAVSLSIANAQLYWPENSSGVDLVATIMDVTPTGPGLSFKMPPANQVGTGRDILVRNLGSDVFTIKDYGGNVITTASAGAAKYIYLTNNSTTAGSWASFTFGTGTSTADATALDGPGLRTISGELASSNPLTVSVTAKTFNSTDRALLWAYNGGTDTWYLPLASSLVAGFWTGVTNVGSGTLTLDAATATGTIDEVGAKQLQPGESVLLYQDGGSAWYSIGYGRSSIFAFTQLSLDVTAGGAMSVTSAQAANKLWYFYNTAASNVTLTIPGVASVYFCRVGAIGAGKTITVTTGGGTAVALEANQSFIIYCDGTNVTQAQTTAIATAVKLADGSAASPSLYFDLDTNTGLYRIGNDQLGLGAGGTKIVEVNTTGIVVTGSISGTAMLFPSTTVPAQTAEGSVVWDSDDDRLTVGTGVGRKTLLNTDSTIDLGVATVTGTKAQFDAAVSDGNICFDGDAATNLTMSTARLLGRTTAATGAVEEISVSGATLSGGVLTIAASTISTVLPMTVVSGISQIAVANNHYVLTNAALSNVTLPAGVAGDIVLVTVANGLATNTITPNGIEEIEGSNTAMTLDITAGTVWLRYVDNTKDWRLM